MLRHKSLLSGVERAYPRLYDRVCEHLERPTPLVVLDRCRHSSYVVPGFYCRSMSIQKIHNTFSYIILYGFGREKAERVGEGEQSIKGIKFEKCYIALQQANSYK